MQDVFLLTILSFVPVLILSFAQFLYSCYFLVPVFIPVLKLPLILLIIYIAISS